jgi:hypothetical protein
MPRSVDLLRASRAHNPPSRVHNLNGYKQNSFYQGEADPATIIRNQRYRSSFYTEPAGASTGVSLPFLPLEGLRMSVETVAMTRT